MKNSLIPATPEGLLETLGADTDFCDDVMGDLAEEFAIRTNWDGVAAARRWYYRECLRVAPYLVRDWCRNLRWRGAATLAKAVVGSSLAVVGVEWILHVAIGGIVAIATGTSLNTSGASAGLATFMLLWTLSIGVFGGYIAAWIGRKAPIPSALLLGVLGSATILLSAVGTTIPWWFRIANVMALVAGTSCGSLIRILGTKLRRNEARS